MKNYLLTLLSFVSLLAANVEGLRCYVCSWTAFHCQDINCYNNPDVCSNNNFSPTVVQPTECAAGCETFVITDPNGLVQQWRRNCDTSGVTYSQEINGASKCKTEYQFGIRLDRCTCNDNFCNGGHSARPDLIVITFSALFVLYYAIKWV